MLALILKNLIRRPLRVGLTVSGLAVAVAALACLLSFSEGYRRSLRREIDGMGMQMMLVPLGCPFDAAAQVLKGRSLESSLPETALTTSRQDPAVALAAPMFAAALPRPALGRTDLWVGVDDSARAMRTWWRLDGGRWPSRPDDVLLGFEAAATEMRRPGDRFYSPETARTFTVCGVLARSGTADDSQFFVPLATAQTMFRQPGRLTGIALRLTDPSRIAEASARLQQVPGAQVVTLTEMMGTFLNLTGAAQSLLLAVALAAVTIAALSVFNTMLAATLERTRELGVLRAIGYARHAVFALMAGESLALSVAGGVLGLVLARGLGPEIERVVRPFLPLAPTVPLPPLTLSAGTLCLSLMALVGVVAGAYPAWQACRLSPVSALRTGS
jgi:putative ABC transport system permease protein